MAKIDSMRVWEIREHLTELLYAWAVRTKDTEKGGIPYQNATESLIRGLNKLLLS